MVRSSFFLYLCGILYLIPMLVTNSFPPCLPFCGKLTWKIDLQKKIDADRQFYKDFKGYDYPVAAERPKRPLRSPIVYILTRYFALIAACVVVTLLVSVDLQRVPVLSGVQSAVLFVTAQIQASFALRVAVGVLAALLFIAWLLSDKDIFIVDYGTLTIPEKNKVSVDDYLELNKEVKRYEQGQLTFQERMARRSGLGPEVGLPDSILAKPPETTLATAREECLFCVGNAIDEMIQRTGVNMREIDYLVVTCSIFNPTPSICSMIANKYKMKPTLKSFNLSGMGCGNGVVAQDLCRDLLKNAKRGAKLLFVTHENITLNWYFGQNRSMLLSNVLFRMNAAAVLMTNTYSLLHPPRFRLYTTVRTTAAYNDKAHVGVYQKEDEEGIVGIEITRDLFSRVSVGLSKNFMTLGMRCLPLAEQLRFAVDFVRRKLSPVYAKEAPQFVPNFKTCFDHFCIHSGGRAIIDSFQKAFNLTDDDCLPSRASLYHFGNTSSSSVWYEMNFIERDHRLKAGDKVWQIGFGSGVKVGSAVWEAL